MLRWAPSILACLVLASLGSCSGDGSLESDLPGDVIADNSDPGTAPDSSDLPGTDDTTDPADANPDLEIHQPLTEVLVQSGDWTARWDFALHELTLARDNDVLLRFPRGSFQFGRVDALDDTLSYDPWYLYPASKAEDFYTAPAGLAWLSPIGAVASRADETGFTLDLAYPDDLKATLRIEAAAPGRFRAFWSPEVEAGNQGPSLAYFRLGPRVDQTEAFYGLGNVHDHVNHRGLTRPMQVEVDLASESANNEAHVRIPLLIGTRGWGIFVESLRAMAFDVATQADDLVEIAVGTGPVTRNGLVFHLLGAEHPLDITRHYYEITGYPRLPARWALGPVIWRDENVDQAKVIADLESIRIFDLAASGYWIDRPYSSAVNAFDFEPRDYDDPAAMVKHAQDLGFRMALWHTPYVDPKDADSKPLYDHAVENGFFPPLVAAQAKWGPPLDFTNPEAWTWWQSLLKTYTDMGIEGWKLDYAEEVAVGAFGLRTKWLFHDGSDERTMHHRYQELYHRVYAEMLPKEGGFLLCRTGMYGDQTNGVIIWPGDLDASFHNHGDDVLKKGIPMTAVGGLRASMIYGLSLGPSGFPFYGSDTGGYIDHTGSPDKELFTRWFQQTALSSVMQVGNGSSTVPWELGGPDGYDQEMLDWYRDYSRLHLRLFPYEWTIARAIADNGRPIQRPFGLQMPELGLHPDDQYFFGDALLVAPVLDRGVVARLVDFPPGSWTDWFTGEVFQGPGTVTVDAPLSKLPLYLAAGGIVPMLRPTIDTMAPVAEALRERVDSFDTDPGLIHVRVAPGPASTFTVYDGCTLSQEMEDHGWRLSYADGSEFNQGAVFELFGVTGKPSAVVLDGESLEEAAGDLDAPGWTWSSGQGGMLRIRIPAGEHLIVITRQGASQS
jgi:alpha-D-xyloside xylohydrolase